jgi:two-component system, OmpR family, response regulator MtrA
MTGARVLVVEDESITRRLLEQALMVEGYSTTSATSYVEAKAAIGRDVYDLILLDIILPGGDGLALCQQIRARRQTPIIMITSRSDSADVVAALEMGADDYIVKPFDLRVLIARVRSHLRRAAAVKDGAEGTIAIGELHVEPSLRDAARQGVLLGLTPMEFELVHLLARRAGRAVSRETIEQELFHGEVRSEKILAVYIRKIREKIEVDPSHPKILFTVRGYGYRIGGAVPSAMAMA